MLQKIKNREQGFTIIEVLIVLAIAGLIMLVVFLAVPNLQRGSRNTSRKSDIGRISGAVSEWSSNNNGAVLTAGTGNANLQSIITSAGTLSQYTLVAAGAIGTNTLNVVTGNQTALPSANIGSVRIVTSASCGTSGATIANSSPRKYAIQYLTETNGGTTPLCQDI